MLNQHPYLGPIPEGWRAVRLDEVVLPTKPIVYGIVQAGPQVDDGVPYLKSTDVGDEINTDSLARTSVAIHQQYARAEVHPGDLVFSLRGDIGQSSIVPAALPLANLTQGTARISPRENFHVEFLKYALASPAVTKRIAMIAKGSSFREISLQQLRELEIIAPDVLEQERIKNVLLAWDQGIRTCERLLHSMNKRYCAIQRLLFPTDGWKFVPLSQLANRVSRKTDGANHPIMTISGKLGFLRQDEKFGRFMAGESVNNYTLLKAGEFAYNKGNSKTYPQGCIYRLHEPSALVPHVYISFRLHENLNADYYAALFQAGFLNRQLVRLINSGVRNDGLLNLNIEDFFTCRVPVPTIEEQARIADILATACGQITATDQEVALLRKQKRGLMQKLLTGEWRVPAHDGEVSTLAARISGEAAQ